MKQKDHEKVYGVASPNSVSTTTLPSDLSPAPEPSIGIGLYQRRSLHKMDRHAMANDLSKTAAQTKQISAQQDLVLFAEVKTWVETKLGRTLEEDFYEVFQSGQILNELLNVLKPNAAPFVYNTSNMAFKKMENIGWFLERARTDFGLVASELFMTIDLFEKHDLRHVALCLNAIKARHDTHGRK